MSDQPQTESAPKTAVERYLAMKAPVQEQQTPQEPVEQVEAQNVEPEGDILEEAQDVELQDGETLDEEVAETEAEYDDDDSSQEELYEVKVNGEVFEVSLEELKAGYQKDRDYQQKTQALAEQRKAVEQEREVLSSVGERLQKLDGTVAYLEETKALLQAVAPNVDQSIIETNPALYIRQKEARDAYLGKLSEIDSRIQEARQEADGTLSELRKAGALTIKEKMPELATQEGASKLYSYLKDSFGYNEAQINANVDPNLFIMAEESRRYREIMARPRKPQANAVKATKSKVKQRPSVDPRLASKDAAFTNFKANPTKQNAVQAYLASKQK